MDKDSALILTDRKAPLCDRKNMGYLSTQATYGRGVGIARELGIAETSSQVLSGADIDGMCDIELAKMAERVRVFARVSPERKARIVEAFRRNGNIVAMTGDGVICVPFIAGIFKVTSLSLRDWAVVLLFSAAPLAVNEIKKLVVGIREKKIVWG